MLLSPPASKPTLKDLLMKKSYLPSLFLSLVLCPCVAAQASAQGSLVGWGDNFNGQTDVPTGNDFVAIAAGYIHNLALRADGSLVGWGYNGNGQTNVPTGNDFTAIAAGDGHSLALRTDGSLMGWGGNFSGQTDVPTGNDFTAIAAGGLHNLALHAGPRARRLGFITHRYRGDGLAA